MSKICVKCEKSVYPLEELKCLDKVWHKLCFRCAECGMLLNMKNYKGYNKQPYCVAHYPKTTHTSVAETPEMARVAQNTKQQSLVKYHEEFEKKIKGSKIEVADDQETQRVMKVNALVSQLEYKGKKGTAVPPPANKPQITQKPILENSSNGDKFSPFTSRNITNSTVYTSDGGKALRSSVIGGRIGSIADYDPMNENYGSLTHGYKPASRQSSVVQADGDDDDDDGFDPEVKKQSDDNDNKHEVETSKDETNENDQQVKHDTSPPPQQHHHQGGAITTNGGNDEEEVREPSTPKAVSPEIIQTADSLSTLVLESVEKDLHESRVVDARREEENDNGKFGDGNGEADAVRLQEAEHVQPAVTEVIGVDDGEGGEIITTPLPGEFIGLYDYEAQDTDEVTFSENDVIVEVEKIDDGWLLGTVARTGQRGMLPANYVQQKK